MKGSGNQKATKLFKTQKEAIAFAKELSKKHEGTVLIHRTTGRVRASISHKDKK
ncbi:UNVERIFIED_CONTAM: DUF2188 domain-containing protein [Campylobacter lari]